jgi:hypothetical protein
MRVTAGCRQQRIMVAVLDHLALIHQHEDLIGIGDRA